MNSSTSQPTNDIIDINACTHFIIHSVYATNELAGKALERIVMSEAKEWETTPEIKEMRLNGSDQTTWGVYLLGSFYYIQEMEVEG